MFALVLAADLTGSVAFSDRTEVRVRDPGTLPPAASLDLETAPLLELRLSSPRWHYLLSYAPRLTFWDVSGAGTQPTFMDAGTARVEWRSHAARLTLDQGGSYGGMSFAAASLAPTADAAPVPVQLIPTAQVIQFASSTTTVTSRVALPWWTVEMVVGYQLSGGADEAARALLPFQRGPFGSAVVTFAASHRDDVLWTVSASEAGFSSGPEGLVAEATVGTRHRWSRLTDTKVSLGVSVARVRLSSTTPSVVDTYPVAEIVAERHPTPVGHLGLRLGVRLGPVVNRLIGLVDERIDASVAVRYEAQGFATHLYSSASQSIPTDGVYATSLFVGELGTAYTMSPVVGVDLGLRALWQRESFVEASFVQGVFFAGMTLRAPPTRL